MIRSACDVMKKTVIFSISLIVIGSLFEVVALLMSLTSVFPATFTYLGLGFILLGLIGLIAITIAIMLPGVSKQLDACQH
jgi:hypothetical protein